VPLFEAEEDDDETLCEDAFLEEGEEEELYSNADRS
jgi:hypothetical protein